MTVHAANTTSGNGHDDFDEGSDFGPNDESQFNELLAKKMKRINAYVRIAREEKQVSQATEDKRKYRAQRKADGFGQYVVEVPLDDDAKHTVYAVAQAIVGDKDDNKKMRSTILSVVSSPVLLKLAELASSSETDVPLIVELIENGDWDKINAIHEAHPGVLDGVLRLMESNDNFISMLDYLLRHADDSSSGPAKGLPDAAMVANDCTDVLRFLEIRGRGGFRGRVLGWLLGGRQ